MRKKKTGEDRVFRTHWMRALLIAEIPVIAVLFSLLSNRDPTPPLVVGVLISVFIYLVVRRGKVRVHDSYLKVGMRRFPWENITKIEEKHQRLYRRSGSWVGPYHHVITVEDQGEERRLSLPEVADSDLFRRELATRISPKTLDISRFEGSIEIVDKGTKPDTN
ncbi:MAG: hypothetical protein GY854_17785 [Deltaproteobacteria bacterium]|nr:hypothetical protein [Deltaproteobacteria bacterium]